MGYPEGNCEYCGVERPCGTPHFQSDQLDTLRAERDEARAQIAALEAERDALSAKLGTVLLCANCGAAAVAATAEEETP